MSVQTSYGFGFPKGVAGGLFDLSAHEVSTRQSEGEGVTFGVGVVVGTNTSSSYVFFGGRRPEFVDRDFEEKVEEVKAELSSQNNME